MRIGDKVFIFTEEYVGISHIREKDSRQIEVEYIYEYISDSELPVGEVKTLVVARDSVNYINISASRRFTGEVNTLFKSGNAYGVIIPKDNNFLYLSSPKIAGIFSAKGRIISSIIPINKIRAITHAPAMSTMARLIKSRLATSNKCSECGGDFPYTLNNKLCTTCFEKARYTCTECGEKVDAYSYASDMEMCHVCLHSTYYNCNGCNKWVSLETPYLEAEQGKICKPCSGEIIEKIEKEPSRSYGYLPTSNSFERNPFRRHVGIELETVGHFHDGWGDSAENPPAGWSFMEDTSIEAYNEGEAGYEFVSVPLSGDALYGALKDIRAHISEWDLYTNNTCGLHIHTSAIETDWRASKGLLLLMYKLEPIINRMISPNRMEKRYSRPLPNTSIGDILDVNSWFDLVKLWYTSMGRGYFSTGKYNETRYRGFNLHSRFLRGTFEFRYHHGTIDIDEIAQWSKFCLGLTEAGLTLGSENTPRINTLRESIINNDTSVKIGDYLELMGMRDMYSYVMSCIRANKDKHKMYLAQNRAGYMLEQYNNLI